MAVPAGLDPASGSAIAGGVLDLLAGGAGTPDAEQWARVCTNSGKCMSACEHGINPRGMNPAGHQSMLDTQSADDRFEETISPLQGTQPRNLQEGAVR